MKHSWRWHVAAAALGASAMVACGSSGADDARAATARIAEIDRFAHVLMTCNTTVGAYEVDPAAAATVLPAEYTLALHTSADGNQRGLVYLQTSKCNGSGNGEDISPFDLADAWLIIEGPPELIDVPGAAFTVPTIYVYVLKAQTTSAWIKESCASIFFQKELVRALNQSATTAMPPRGGNLVEMTGKGYEWVEFLPCGTPPGSAYGECWMFPAPDPRIPVGYAVPALPVGFNVKGYINQGNGKVAKKEMACVMSLFGQGLIQLDIDPKSHMMEAGVFGPSQIGLSYDAVATCDLLIAPE